MLVPRFRFLFGSGSPEPFAENWALTVPIRLVEREANLEGDVTILA